MLMASLPFQSLIGALIMQEYSILFHTILLDSIVQIKARGFSFPHSFFSVRVADLERSLAVVSIILSWP